MTSRTRTFLVALAVAATLLASLALFSSSAAAQQVTDCHVIDFTSSSLIFDLTPLRRSGNESNYVTRDTRGHTYHLNICGPLTQAADAEPCNSKFASKGAISGCQDKEGDSSFPHHIGHSAQPPQLLDPNDPTRGVVLLYSGTTDISDVCSNGGVRTTKIIFTCGQSRGRPIFLDESSKCQYVFQWETDLVCPSAASASVVDELPCYTQDDNGDIIDLSPLVSSIYNWEVLDETHGGDKYKYFISICRPLVDTEELDNGCGTNPNSAACQTRVTDPTNFTPVSLGMPTTPTFSNGELSVLYELGDRCEGHNVARKAQIFFTCPPAAHLGLGSPKFREEVDCFYIFDWETTAACVSIPIESHSCSVTDSNGVVYDLSPLKDRVYTTFFGSTKYEFGVCGSRVHCGGGRLVAVCQTTGDGKKTALASSTDTLQVVDGHLQSLYNDSNVQIITTYVCNPSIAPTSSAHLATIINIEKDEQRNIISIVFQVETSIACHETVECALQHDGESYDLSPLIRDSYWRIDTDFDGQDYSYLINVCQEVSAPSLGCEYTGGCQLDVGGKVYEMGQINSPRFVGDNLVLEYTNGQPCGSVNRSLTITFECDRTVGVQGSITALPEKEQCHYEFIWETAVACPLETETDEGCQVTDSRTGQVFDLTSLRDAVASRDVRVETESGKTFHVGLCKKASFCSNNDAVCDKSRTSQGVANAELSFNQDSLFLTYEHGAACDDGRTRSTAVKFVCDEDASNAQSAPTIVADDGCLLELEWKTPEACVQQFETIDCIAYNKNKRYDLTRLLDPTSNYNAEDQHQHLTFHINICRPVVLDHINGCGAFSGGCAEDTSGNVFSIGKATEGPKFETKDGQDLVVLDYEDGKDGASTRIEFVCPADDFSDETLNSLIYDGYNPDTKQYIFRMYSPFACEVRVHEGANCQYHDESTDMTMDFTSLRREQPYVVNADGFQYTINMCSEVNCEGSTEKNAAACQRKLCGDSVCEDAPQAKNMGKVSMKPSFENNILRLTYTHGDRCAGGTLYRRTVIELICDPSEDEKGPEFIGEDAHCLYLFQWKTQHACKPQLGHCSAVDSETGAEYDLDALIRKDYTLTVGGDVLFKSPGNWLAHDEREEGKYEYRINVCRPLVADPSIKCGPFAAVCQVDTANDNHFTLGYPLKGPEFTDGQLQIQYTLGDSYLCAGPRKATIKFSCNHEAGALGSPVFEYEGNDCDYVFSWATSAACPRGGNEEQTSSTSTTTGPFTLASCKFTHPSTGEVIDMSDLMTSTDGVLHTTGKDPHGTLYDFYVGICRDGYSESGSSSGGSGSDCQGAGACQVSSSGSHVSLGKTNHHLFLDGDFLMLNYVDGPLCHGQYHRQTTVVFLCDPNQTGKPELHYVEETGECTYRFEVHTARVCMHDRFAPCTAIDDATGQEFDLSPLMSSGADYGVEIPGESGESSSSTRVSLNVCRSLVHPFTSCTPGSAGCIVSGSLTRSLGFPASPYVTSNHVLAMRLSSPGCPGNSEEPFTNTTIIFECSSDGEHHNPQLELYSSVRTCDYIISWFTPLACPASTSTTEAPASDLTRDDCYVADEYERFDLSVLEPEDAREANEDANGPYSYRVTACGSIACGAENSGAVCQSQNKNHWSLGKFTERPKLTAGVYNELSVTYTDGDSCSNGAKRKSRITFVCEDDPNIHGVYYEGETIHCEYEFTWLTDKVCSTDAIPHHDLSCSVTDPKTSRVYRLDKLIRGNDASENWLARNEATSEDNGKGADFQFYINVCRPLAPKQITDGVIDEVCRGSGVCQLTSSSHQFSGGYASSEPEFTESGDVILRYTLPHSYSIKCHSTYVRSAIITFTCQEGTLGSPSFIGESDECEYQFHWPTSVVCDYHETKGKDCRVTDADTGTVCDLSPLAGKMKEVQGSDGYTYQLTVCEAPKEGGFDGCDDEETGGCQLGSYTYSTGQVNSELFITSGGLGLEYTGGQRCHDNKFERSTFIEFICDASAGDGSPEFLAEEDDCSYIFRWRTAHACEKATDFECVVEDTDGNQYDLTPLKRLSSYWTVQNRQQADQYMYAINVCHNIVPSGDAAGCPENSGVCQWEAQGGDSARYWDLGHTNEPQWKDGQLVITYDHGTECTSFNPPKPRKTIVTLTCKESAGSGDPLGTPYFDKEDGCEYHIKWETSAACPVSVTEEPSSGDNTDEPDACIFEDTTTQAIIDLTRVDTSNLRYEKNGVVFTMDPCAKTRCETHSSDSFLCQETQDHSQFSLGKRRSAVFRDNELYMHFFSGTYCEIAHKSRESFVIFQCDEESETPELVFTSEVQCTYNFIVKTKAACVSSPRQCVVKDTRFQVGWEYDLSPLMAENYVSLQTDDGELVFNLCKGVEHPKCASDAGACLVSDSGRGYTIGRYTEDTQPTLRTDKSLIHLLYNGQCPTGNIASTVEITFTCAKGKQTGPKLERSSGCDYVVSWPTCRVCEGSNPCNDVAPTTTPRRHGPTTPPGGDGGNTSPTSGKKTSGGVTFVIILVVLSVVGGGAYYLMSPAQRARVWSALPGAKARTYKKMKKKHASAGQRLFDDSSSDEDDNGAPDESKFGIGAFEDSSSDEDDNNNNGGPGGERARSGKTLGNSGDTFALHTLNDEESLLIGGSKSSTNGTTATTASNNNNDDDDDVPLAPF